MTRRNLVIKSMLDKMTDRKQSDSELRRFPYLKNSNLNVLDQLSSVLQTNMVRIGQKSSYIAKCLKAGTFSTRLVGKMKPSTSQASLNFDNLVSCSERFIAIRQGKYLSWTGTRTSLKSQKTTNIVQHISLRSGSRRDICVVKHIFINTRNG